MKLRLDLLAIFAASSELAGTDTVALAFTAVPRLRQRCQRQQQLATSTSSTAHANTYARTKWSPHSPPPSSSFSSGSVPGPCPYSSTASSSYAANYDEVRADLRSLMDNPSWDDGSLAPSMIETLLRSARCGDKQLHACMGGAGLHACMHASP